MIVCHNTYCLTVTFRNSKHCMVLADCYLPFSAVGEALRVTPENGMIMVFGDSGDYKPGSWPGHLQTSKLKNIKIFWICTPVCPLRRGQAWEAAYEGLSEGRVYETASNLNTDQFFKDAVLTVGKLDISPCICKSYPVVTLSISG